MFCIWSLNETGRLLNHISLCLLVITGFNTAPDPLPPDMVIDMTLSTSKCCWSTNTSCIDPFTTGWTIAVVPVPGEGILIVGKLITSKFLPWFNILKSESGPK